jgi:hypothetical protein
MDYIYKYQTKNLINGKTYVGVHTTNRLNDGYIGCGIKSDASCRSQIKAGRNYPFINAIAKYGYKNFKKEILSFYENIEDAYSDEEYIVDEKWVLNKNNYNASLGGMFSVRPKRLEEFKEDINRMFSNINISYEEISEKYNTTKGSWISLITDDSILKRKTSIKENKNTGLKVENINGDVFELKDLISFKKQTGLCSKSIHKLTKNGYSKKWYLCGSEKLIKKRKEIEGVYITLKDKKVFLKEIYECGVSNFAVNNKINLSTLEVKLRKAKNGRKK